MRSINVSFTILYNLYMLIILGTNIYYYIFINIKIRVAYIKIFYILFKAIYNVASEPVIFRYLNKYKRGIKTIIINIYKKQAPGIFIYILLYIIIAKKNHFSF